MTGYEQTIRPVAPGGPGGCGCGCGGGGAGTGGSGSGGCGCGDCLAGHATGRLRPRWFGGQLVGPEDLTQTGVWLLERMRRHNRLLHGWGVVCGATVNPVRIGDGGRRPWLLDVSAGYVLGPYGDEIVIEHPLRVDVRDALPGGTEGCPPPTDPWCAPVRRRREPGRTYYLAVRYDECLTAPVAAAGCGCEDTACEYSRVREGFVLGVLDTLPPAYLEGIDDTLQETTGCSSRITGIGTRPCPSCPTDPWVVLADFTASADGRLTVDPLYNRRFAASFGGFGFYCGQPGQSQAGARWGEVTRQAAAHAFAESHAEDVLTADDPAAVRALPARALLAVADTPHLADVLGGRTVAELARTDAATLIERARAAAVPPGPVLTAIDRAHLVLRLTEG
ncbi:hypothetical protein [Embleya hyalina]|uniref:Uncharacterized protein n=1 Tax=Embleya hyalina TaxID=516124 RepID=A0A401YQ38_9ACTN|nr:hypothetical protein [Embleya hyalina]GCD96718.1 hypothetical protein EHYA_04405 [Embleya hyalina]